MSDISILEFGVYGFLTYTGMLMLIISSVRGLPEDRSRINTLAQACFLLPSLICAPVLATSGVEITTQHSEDIIRDLNSTTTWSDISNNAIILENPVWLTVHMMMFFVILIFIIRQILLLLLASP